MARNSDDQIHKKIVVFQLVHKLKCQLAYLLSITGISES